MHGPSRKAFLVGGAMVALSACGGTSPTAGTGASGTMQPVDLKMMVGGLNKQIYLPNMLAKQLGYFDAEKINVTLVDEGSGQGTELEVVAGEGAAGPGRRTPPVGAEPRRKMIENTCPVCPSSPECAVVGNTEDAT